MVRANPAASVAWRVGHGGGSFAGRRGAQAVGRVRASAHQHQTRRGCLNGAPRRARSEFRDAAPLPSTAAQSAQPTTPHEPPPWPTRHATCTTHSCPPHQSKSKLPHTQQATQSPARTHTYVTWYRKSGHPHHPNQARCSRGCSGPGRQTACTPAHRDGGHGRFSGLAGTLPGTQT